MYKLYKKENNDFITQYESKGNNSCRYKFSKLEISTRFFMSYLKIDNEIEFNENYYIKLD